MAVSESWNDEFADYPETSLYMIGNIEEAKSEAEGFPPMRILLDQEVTKIVAEAENGSFCLLFPGILILWQRWPGDSLVRVRYW